MHKYLVMMLLALASCGNPNRNAVQEVSLGEGIGLTMPEDFRRGTDMHDYAPVQFSSTDENVYMLGFADAKAELLDLDLRYKLEDYAYVSYRKVASGLDSVIMRDTLETKINGMECIVTEFDAVRKIGDESLVVTYNLACFEGQRNFCQLISWAPKEHASDLRENIAPVFASVRELEGQHHPGTGTGAEALQSAEIPE